MPINWAGSLCGSPRECPCPDWGENRGVERGVGEGEGVTIHQPSRVSPQQR